MTPWSKLFSDKYENQLYINLYVELYFCHHFKILSSKNRYTLQIGLGSRSLISVCENIPVCIHKFLLVIKENHTKYI